ncbi:MAG: S46 family peptidase [Bacteroidetes bacterium]|nr:S46 family peptidase [Bacteroidota bacterium]
MNKLLFIVSLVFIFNKSVRADEGMLIPSLIAAFESDMKAKGMKLTAKDIYNVNKASLKDAILQFGGGCTAELVSDRGLLLTNHHCGYSQIQSHSSLENDYLKYGYWAKTNGDELQNPGLTAVRIVRIEDVTKSILGLGKTDDASIQALIKELTAKAVIGTHYEAEIKPFNYGNDYYMMVKEVFLDVRFVGSPPNSIGKFGGDTDNWVWPRHTGDFSVFRIYVGKDNKPAPYSVENVPYNPIYYLPISFKNRKEGDFTMVYGFPGSTEQHVVSSYLKFIIEKERPARIRMRDLSLSIIDAAMKESDKTRIQYSAKQASIANAWKKWIGQIDGLKRLDAVTIKINREKEYLDKANSNPDWALKYGNVIQKMNELVAKKIDIEFQYAMGMEYFSYGPEYFKLIRSLNDLLMNYSKYKEKNELTSVITKLKTSAEGFFKNYDENVDEKIFELLTVEYLKQIGDNNLSETEVIELKNEIYSQSVLTNKERFINFLNSCDEESKVKLENDPGFKYYNALISKFRSTTVPNFQTFNAEMTSLLKIYVEGKKVMFPKVKHWPDANSTLRISYGKLEGSTPTDGMKYTEHTTLDGIIAKYNSGNPDFELLPRMLDLHKMKDYGPYGQNGELWVCFTGSNHTTGGNSGSPVLDKNGYLMGLNFDRTWESTMSDYMFDASRCRNVVVDIRYVLWVIDKYSGAKHLVDEMKLVKGK